MSKLDELYKMYESRQIGPVKTFSSRLREVPKEEITSPDDALRFIEMVRYEREEVEDGILSLGENCMDILTQLLSSGDDGMYFNPDRYLLELLQNVDDCRYTGSDPQVDIFFDTKPGHNEIVYKYNEDGFTPKNVHDITGIGAESKTSTSEEEYIGEKGIGFKSVFGVADKVLIQSGWFSFEIYKEDFIIPKPAYNDFSEYVPGTVLTLFISESINIAETFKRLKTKYSGENAIFSENPILFLHKLQCVTFHDRDSKLIFEVVRDKNANLCNGLLCIHAVLRIERKGGDRTPFKNEIGVYQFTQSIRFTQEDFKSRYDSKNKKTKVYCDSEGRNYRFVSIVPDEKNIEKFKNISGCLYSYFPTQIKTTVPISLHIPYCLKATREFINTQGRNLWFVKCVNAQKTLLQSTYREIAAKFGESVLYFLPRQGDDFFAKGEDPNFNDYSVSRDVFTGMRIFRTKNGYKNLSEIVCLDPNEKVSDHIKAYELSGLGGNLFCCPVDCDPSSYGIRIEHKIYRSILSNALVSPKSCSDALDYLEGIMDSFEKANENSTNPSEPAPLTKLDFDKKCTLTDEQLKCFFAHERIFSLMQENAIYCLKTKFLPGFSVEVNKQWEFDIHDQITNFNDSINNDTILSAYFNHNSGRCLLMDFPEDFFLPASNKLCLSQASPFNSYITFLRSYGSHSLYVAQSVTAMEINKLRDYVNDNSISDSDFFDKVVEKQKYIKSVLGEKEYQSLVDKFINIGITPIRCIKELLQNADDCDYETDSSYICVKFDDGKFIITYNEAGFKREDLMAITSLSSSTKDKASHLIGKKGVGFKSVFGVASEVEIHSNAFDFKLSKDTPTIPESLKPLESRQEGTTIIFKASTNDIAVKIRDYLSTNNLIKDILCLRNLKIFNIFGSIVEASDTGNIREIVSERDGSYKFWRYQESFIVDKSGEGFDAHDKTQKINCYYQVSSVMPGSRNVENPIDSYLYCGLPTETKCCNGISVDAEFNLDLPREGLVADAWNEYLLEKSVGVMLGFLHRISENLSSNLKSKVFDLLGMEFNNTTKDVDIKLFSDYHIRVEDYWLSKLKETEFLPTYESNVYIAPSTPGCVRYPAVAHMLLEDGKKFSTPSRSIMNGPVTDMDSIYRKLGIKAQDEEKVLDEISPYIVEYITKSNGAKVRTKNNFADRLYSYLSNLDTDIKYKLKDRIRNLPIIPILDFDSNESTRFICKNEGDVYLYRDDVIDSERDISSFMFLDESIMTDKTFFNVFDVYPRILSEYSINKNYSDRLVERIEYTNCEDDEERKELYRYLLNEYTIGKITKHNCLNLISVKYREGKIPLKNKNGDIVTHAVFLYYENTSDGPFKGMLMNEFAVSTECYDFACYATQCDDLYMIVEDSKSECVFDYLENNPDFMLTLDDLDDLKSSYFRNVLKICPFVMELYSNDYVDDDMLDASGLKVIIDTIAPNLFNDYEFPSERVNEQSLNSYMDKEYPTYGKIVDEVKECKVKMLECGTDRFPLDYKEVRQNIMERYSPIKGKCFCQRCGAIKPDSFIEVVEIEEEPSILAIPMNLALCLECAKTYQALRHISSWIDLFVKQLGKASHGGNEPIVISFGKDQQQYTYKFKQTHLAEIQYILKHDKGI